MLPYGKTMKKKNTLSKNIRRIFGEIRKYPGHLSASLLLQIFCSFLLPLTATVITSRAVSLITGRSEPLNFVVHIAALASVYILISVGKMLGEKFYQQSIPMVCADSFAVPLFEKLLTTDYENIESGENQQIFRKAVQSISGNTGPAKLLLIAPALAVNLLGLLSYSVLIFQISILILIVLVAMTLVNILLNGRARKYQQDHWDEKWSEVCRAAYVYRRSVDAEQGKDIRIYGIEKWFHQLFEEIIDAEVRWHGKVELRYLFPQLTDSIFLCARDLIAYGMLIAMFVEGEVDAAGFTFYLGIVSGFSAWLNGFVEAAAGIARANMEFDQYQEAMLIEDHAGHGVGRNISGLTVPLEITFSHVNFRYPGSDKDTLHDLSFTINAGEKIALVGTNGAGKTTIVKLICGFYRPDSGQILVNGIPVSEFDMEEYQRLIGVAFQDLATVGFTIGENISGVPLDETDPQRLKSALEQSGLSEKIGSFAAGEKTYLGADLSPEGEGLSGGELQKLILARALYKDAPLLILDEPTSALDPLAEAELYRKYCELTMDKTSVFISHRLASTRFCDRIFFLEDGTVKEAGSHEMLMEMGGAYARMFDIQSHYYRGEQMNTEKRREAAYE